MNVWNIPKSLATTINSEIKLHLGSMDIEDFINSRFNGPSINDDKALVAYCVFTVATHNIIRDNLNIICYKCRYTFDVQPFVKELPYDLRGICLTCYIRLILEENSFGHFSRQTISKALVELIGEIIGLKISSKYYELLAPCEDIVASYISQAKQHLVIDFKNYGGRRPDMF